MKMEMRIVAFVYFVMSMMVGATFVDYPDTNFDYIDLLERKVEKVQVELEEALLELRKSGRISVVQNELNSVREENERCQNDLKSAQRRVRYFEDLLI